MAQESKHPGDAKKQPRRSSSSKKSTDRASSGSSPKTARRKSAGTRSHHRPKKTRYVNAWEAAEANKANILHAIDVVVKRRNHPDFQEMYDDLVDLYVKFYDTYDKPIVTAAQDREFNRLAGWKMRTHLLHRRMQIAKQNAITAEYIARAQAEPAPYQETPEERLAAEEQLAALAGKLTERQRQILALRLREESVSTIARTLHLSRVTITNEIAVIRQVYESLSDDKDL